MGMYGSGQAGQGWSRNVAHFGDGVQAATALFDCRPGMLVAASHAKREGDAARQDAMAADAHGDEEDAG